MRSVKSKVLRKIVNLNKSGYGSKKAPLFSALKKHTIVFENKEYSFSLSDLKKKKTFLKSELENIKEKRLETLKFKGKYNLNELRKKAISLNIEKSKYEILENLILHKELLSSTPALKMSYSKMINKLFLAADSLYLNGKTDKKYLFLSNALKSLTEKIVLRTTENRRRLFGHVSQEILKDFSKEYSL
jgi:hypothetical protein